MPRTKSKSSDSKADFKDFWLEVASAGVERVEVVFPKFPDVKSRIVYTTNRNWVESLR